LPDPQALAREINARMSDLGVTQQQLAERSGVSVAAIRGIQKAQPRRRSPVILSAISRALRWPDDHLRGVYEADAPVVASDDGDDLTARLDRMQGQIDDLCDRLAGLEAQKEGR
jgi:transcriptional regulator with XRE-family HTH domain